MSQRELWVSRRRGHVRVRFPQRVLRGGPEPGDPLSWTRRLFRGEGMKGSGRRRSGGARGRSAALSSLSLPPTEGPSLRGFRRGRSVRLQDPSGEHCGPWEGGAVGDVRVQGGPRGR